MSKSRFPLYPILVGLFPVLNLAATNLAQIDLSQIYRSLLFSLALAFVLVGLLWLLLRDWSRAAFLSGCLLVLFYSYGQVYNLLLGTHLFQAPPAGHIPMAILWLGLAVVATGWSVRKSVNLSGLTLVLNIFAVVLLVYPLFQIGRIEYDRFPFEAAPNNPQNPRLVQPPDIYYIILDAYERADTLKLVYDYDNSAFLNELKARGFYVAACSQSNYAYTQLSLASSLNMEYLDTLSIHNNDQADQALQQNAVRQFLKGQGYRIISLESGFRWSQWEDADVYYPYRPEGRYLNGFEALFLRTTLVRLPLDYIYSEQDAAYGVIPYNRILFELDRLKALSEAVGGPKFVFAHLSIPHPPFVFGPQGQFITAGAENATSIEGYQNSVRFINQQILEVVDSILAHSARPPVIILQGDHGGPKYDTPTERMTILNAYDLPKGDTTLYASLSPVNTFRLVLDNYFNQHYPLLEDVSYYSYPEQEYAFGAIPNECGK